MIVTEKTIYSDLSKLPIGSNAIVTELPDDRSFCRRLLSLGLTTGGSIVSAFKGPFNDPVAFLFKDTIIALRLTDAAKIKISYKTEGEHE